MEQETLKAQVKCTLPNPTTEHDKSGGLPLSPTATRDLFRKLGFSTKRSYPGAAQMVTGDAPVTFYEVLLPRGWREEGDYLVDTAGYYRAKVERTCADDPVLLQFFCRFSMLNNPHWSFYKTALKQRRDYNLLLVADRTKTAEDNPIDFTNAIVWKGEYRSKPFTAESALKVLKGPARKPWGPYKWLQENYPDYKNPLAYW